MYRRKKTKEKNPEDFNRGLGYAMFLLNLRMQSEQELRLKMIDRGFVTKVITQVVEELLRLKYINDELMAENLVQSYKQYKPYGYMKIKLKLMEKKLPTGVIEKVLEEKMSEEDELEIAKKVVKKVNPNDLKDIKAKQKTARSLASRGFRSSVVSKLVFN